MLLGSRASKSLGSGTGAVLGATAVAVEVAELGAADVFDGLVGSAGPATGLVGMQPTASNVTSAKQAAVLRQNELARNRIQWFRRRNHNGMTRSRVKCELLRSSAMRQFQSHSSAEAGRCPRAYVACNSLSSSDLTATSRAMLREAPLQTEIHEMAR